MTAARGYIWCIALNGNIYTNGHDAFAGTDTTPQIKIMMITLAIGPSKIFPIQTYSRIYLCLGKSQGLLSY